jgi:hypothetical protein
MKKKGWKRLEKYFVFLTGMCFAYTTGPSAIRPQGKNQR